MTRVKSASARRLAPGTAMLNVLPGRGVQTGYAVAVDVGGTCTDCVVFREGEPVHVGKSFSTPPDFAHGVMDSVRSAAAGMGTDLPGLLGSTRLFLHGSTVVDNTLFTRDGSVTGLITTAGFEDVTDESLEARMRAQSELAVDEADVASAGSALAIAVALMLAGAFWTVPAVAGALAETTASVPAATTVPAKPNSDCSGS